MGLTLKLKILSSFVLPVKKNTILRIIDKYGFKENIPDNIL
jgi:hypothetical protein